MIMEIAGVAACVLPAVGRRVAGGALDQWFGWNLGDQPVRLFFGATVGAVVAVALMGVALSPWPWEAYTSVAGAVLAVWVGCTIAMGGIGLGRETGGSRTADALGVLLHGAATGALLLVALLPWLYIEQQPAPWIAAAPIAAGLAMPLLYELGWRITGQALGSGGVPNPRFPRGLQSGSEWGELLWGFVIGLGVWAAVSC